MTIDVEDAENAAREDEGDIQPPAGHQGVPAGNDGAAEASRSEGKVVSPQRFRNKSPASLSLRKLRLRALWPRMLPVI